MKNFTYYILLVSLLLLNSGLGLSAKLKSETEKKPTENPYCPGIWSYIKHLTMQINSKIARLNKLNRLKRPLDRAEAQERTKLIQEKDDLIAERFAYRSLYETDCKDYKRKITPIVDPPQLDIDDANLPLEVPIERVPIRSRKRNR